MTGKMRITAEAASQIARSHDAAADALGGVVGTLPASVDGGEASAILSQIPGKVTADCADLLRANRGAAAIMREVGTDYQATDDQLASDFRRIGSDMDGHR